MRSQVSLVSTPCHIKIQTKKGTKKIRIKNLEIKTILIKIDEKTPINNLKEIKYT